MDGTNLSTVVVQAVIAGGMGLVSGFAVVHLLATVIPLGAAVLIGSLWAWLTTRGMMIAAETVINLSRSG